MNEQLQTLLLDLVQRSILALESGATFLAGEIPEVIQQLLIWKAVESSIWFVFWVILSALVFYYLGVKGFKLAKTYEEESGGASYFCWIPLFGIACSITIPSIIHNLDWLQILVAPKLYLFEYAAELMKGK